MSNELNKFEEGIKNSIENFEPSYDAQSWESLNSALNTSSKTRIINNTIATGLIAAGLFFGGTTLITELNNNEIVVENILTTPNNPINESESYNLTNTQPVLDDETSTITDESASDAIMSTSEETSSANLNETNVSAEESSSPTVLSNSHFSTDITSACIGTSIQFNVTNGTSGKDCLWNFGDGSFSNGKNPEHVFTRPGIYDVSLSVSTEDEGSIESTSIKKMIRIEDKPVALFEWNTIKGEDIIPHVTFNNKSLHAQSLKWYVDGELVSRKRDIKRLFKESGEHVIKLVVSNSFGCTDSTFRHINIKEGFNLFAPLAITPNDDKQNDEFMPKALTHLNQSFEMNIFDQKSGELIFTSNSINSPWKGKNMKTNKKVNPAEYAWVVQLLNGEEFSGVITVLP